MDNLILYHGLSQLQSFRRYIPQHLQFVSRLSDQRTQSNGNGQSYHSGSGNSYAHGILQNVGAK